MLPSNLRDLTENSPNPEFLRSNSGREKAASPGLNPLYCPTPPFLSPLHSGHDVLGWQSSQGKASQVGPPLRQWPGPQDILPFGGGVGVGGEWRMCQRQIGEQIFCGKGRWVASMLGETPLHPKPWNPSSIQLSSGPQAGQHFPHPDGHWHFPRSHLALARKAAGPLGEGGVACNS